VLAPPLARLRWIQVFSIYAPRTHTTNPLRGWNGVAGDGAGGKNQARACAIRPYMDCCVQPDRENRQKLDVHVWKVCQKKRKKRV